MFDYLNTRGGPEPPRLYEGRNGRFRRFFRLYIIKVDLIIGRGERLDRTIYNVWTWALPSCYVQWRDDRPL